MRALAVLWLLSGCECAEGEMRCGDKGILVCEADGKWYASSCCADCRELTIDNVDTAVCSPSDEPDPRCADASDFEFRCDGETFLKCDRGFSSLETACPVACVSPAPGKALCALDEVPDPRCSPVGFERVCARDRILTCIDGFLTGEDVCPAEFPECADTPNNLGGIEPTCATAPTLECAADSPSRCSGNDIFGCYGGRKTFTHCEISCYQNPADSMFPEAFCEISSCSF